MLELHIERFGGLDLYRVKDSESNFSAAFIPDAGGILNEFICDIHGQSFNVIDGYADAKELLSDLSLTFKSAKLSPYPNRISNGQYLHEGKIYRLENNFQGEKNSIHGLVYKRPFFVEHAECKDERCELLLSYKYKQEDEGYPFQYTISVKYTIEKNKLTCETTIENKDTQVLPMGDGWHPYFQLGGMIDVWQLKLPECSLLEVNDLIPTGETISYENYASFKKLHADALDSCFKVNERSALAEIKLIHAEKNITLNYWQESGEDQYRYFQLYTPPSRKSIAIEPMSCPPDAFNSKKDLILLEPKGKLVFSWGFEISAL